MITYSPVVVHMAQLVRNLLDVIWSEGCLELQHIVVGGGDSALSDSLGDQEEVEMLIQGDPGVNEGTGERVDET